MNQCVLHLLSLSLPPRSDDASKGEHKNDRLAAVTYFGLIIIICAT